MTDNLWHWWQEALAGRFGPIHDSDPQQGYYRTRFKDKPWEPVAIWNEDGKWHAMRGERTVDAAEIWTWCCRNPISYEAYQKAIDGAGWMMSPKHRRSATTFPPIRLRRCRSSSRPRKNRRKLS